MLSPDSSGSRQLIELRKENTEEKLRNTMSRFQQFKSNNPTLTHKFKVFQFDKNPNFAALIIDSESENSVCLYSPYLSIISQDGSGTGRADMPHYLVSKKKHRIYKYVCDYVFSYIEIAKEFL